ncbi:MAG: hypothetical protein PHO44_02975 [Sphaerochaetaceae bacterium]|jgi:hypothetical protein|nr:hypothetical protein [Sphaerochaetaceae bacterium]MDD3162974.1 hypothetical protein [Sphaerochaetaceae bacterium]MDD4006922.1 hypothetical protein [Sphaerochaetaceae bacterium]MDD4396431.1 hypothetical protein [Sphaerochaetaceae bacterium]
MRIEPFFSPEELLTSYFVTDENTRTGVFINLSEISMKMIRRLRDTALYTVLICDNRASVLKNIELLRKIYPFAFHDFHNQNRLHVGSLEIEKIDLPERISSVFRINNVLFSGNADISGLLGKLRSDLVILPSDGPISTVKTEIILQEHSRLSQISQA